MCAVSHVRPCAYCVPKAMGGCGAHGGPWGSREPCAPTPGATPPHPWGAEWAVLGDRWCWCPGVGPGHVLAGGRQAGRMLPASPCPTLAGEGVGIGCPRSLLPLSWVLIPPNQLSVTADPGSYKTPGSSSPAPLPAAWQLLGERGARAESQGAAGDPGEPCGGPTKLCCPVPAPCWPATACCRPP